MMFIKSWVSVSASHIAFWANITNAIITIMTQKYHFLIMDDLGLVGSSDTATQ